MTLDAMVFKIFCERDVSDAGTLRCGRFCDAGIASVACINLYPFFWQYINISYYTYCKKCSALTGVAVAEVADGDVG